MTGLRINSSMFDLQLLHDQSRDQGTWLYYWKGRRCSCNKDGDSNRSVLTCKVCGGTGSVYPTAPIYLRGLISDASGDLRLTAAGIYWPGDLKLSLDTFQVEVGDGDLVRLDPLDFPQGESYMGDVLLRGSGTTDRLQHYIAALDSVVQDNPDTGITTGYANGTDFTISNNQITWIGSHKPAAGSSYGVYYRAFFPYLIFVPPAVRMERGQQLTQQALLRRRDIVLSAARSGGNGNPIT